MRVSELGEFGLIEVLSRELGVPYPPVAGAEPRPGLLVDLGDDALVAARADEALILTTDTMVEGIHFLPERMRWEDVGWKALASNISDVAAMGGTPRLALVTLMLPPDTEVGDLTKLYRGLRECADAYEVLIAGGDIVRGPAVAVTVALTGKAIFGARKQVLTLRRDTACAGDLVAVTGTLGDSAGGLRLIQAENPTETSEHLLEAHARPRPRVDAGLVAVRAGIKCAMDVSDGLVQDLGHIARASGVTINVQSARIPLSDSLRRLFHDDYLQLALTGGEDYQLILIGSKDALEKVAESVEDVTIVGEVMEGEPRVVVLDMSGEEVSIERGGWDHMAGANP